MTQEQKWLSYVAKLRNEHDGELETLRGQIVDATLERDELDEQYKKAVARFRDSESRCIEMGTKNAECWNKINELERENTLLAQKCSDYADRIQELEDTLGLKYNS